MEETKYDILNSINSPADLRRLDVEQLPQLCDELRRDIIKEVSMNPGHLASSLGVVELTVALHYVFNTPEDYINGHDRQLETAIREMLKITKK